MVVKQPNADLPVYVVRPEVGGGKNRTLHRNLLLPCNFLPKNAPASPRTPIPESRRVPRKHIPDPESIPEVVSDVEDEIEESSVNAWNVPIVDSERIDFPGSNPEPTHHEPPNDVAIDDEPPIRDAPCEEAQCEEAPCEEAPCEETPDEGAHGGAVPHGEPQSPVREAQDPHVPPPQVQGEQLETASDNEEDCLLRRSKRCPRQPDRLVYYQSQVLQPIVESEAGCFILFALTVLMLVKIVFLLFSLTEILVSVGVIMSLIMLSCFPNVNQRFADVIRVYKASVSFWKEKPNDRMTKFARDSEEVRSVKLSPKFN